MTRLNMPEGWKIKALECLWNEAAKPAGLLVQNVKELLANAGVVVDFSRSFPEAPEKNADIRAMITANFQYSGARLINMREWLQAHFPVHFYGETVYSQNEVVFLYKSRADYAAARLEYIYPSLKSEERTFSHVASLLAAECGLTEADLLAALQAYPGSFVRVASGMLMTGNIRLHLPISEKATACIGQEIIRAVRSQPGGSMSAAGVPNMLPCIKNFYNRNIKNAFRNWIGANCPQLDVSGQPPIVRVVTPDNRGSRSGWNPSAAADQNLWQTKALKALWEAAHQGAHEVSVGSKEITTEGLIISEVETILKACGVSWRSCRMDEFQTIESWLEQCFPVCLQEVAAEGWSYTRVLFRFEPLSDYAAVKIWTEASQYRPARQQGGDGMLLPVLKNQLCRNYGIWEELVDEAISRYPDCYRLKERDGNQYFTLIKPSTRTVVPMPDHIRVHTNQVLQNAISAEPTGRFPIANVHLIVPWVSDYYSKDLRAWLPTAFSVEVPEEAPDSIRSCDSRRWSMIVIRDLLRRCMGQSVCINALPELAREAQFDLLGLIDGRSLKEWAQELAEQTDVELTRDGESVYVPLPKEDYPPMPVLPISRVEAETNQALNFCLFSWDALKQLPQKSGYRTVDVYRRVWQRYVGSLLADALAGVSGELMYDEQHVPMRAALDMRLTTPEGNPLYAVLEQLEPEAQNLFRLLGVAVPGVDAEEELGRYLYETFKLTSGSATQQSFVTLGHLMNELEALREVLIREAEEAEEAFRDGRVALPEELAPHMLQWQSLWQEVESAVNGLGWRQDFADGLTLAAIRDRMQSLDVEHQMIEDAIARFDAMLGSVDAFIENGMRYGGYDGMREQILIDRKTAASSRFATREDVGEFGQLMAPYEALRTLAQASYGESCDEALHVICGHFRLAVFNAGMMHGAGSNPDLPLYCLNGLDEIARIMDNILAQIARRSTTGEKKPPVDASVLYDQLRARTKEKTVFPASYIFPEDELEAMIVRGEMTSAAAWVREQPSIPAEEKERLLAALREAAAGDMSMALPDIGMRLMMTVGNRSRSAERYLLSACLQSRSGQEETRRLLLDIYRRENRTQDFTALFRDVQGGHDLETRKYYVYVLSAMDYSAMKAYLQQHIYLAYDPRCLEKMREAAANAGDEQLSALLAKINPVADVAGDALSEAIEAGEYAQAALLAEDPAYAGRDLSRLRDALEEPALLPAGKDLASRGRRLYLCLGNWGRLAEKRLLDALASETRDEVSAAAVQLVQLYRSEERWSEGGSIYEYYSRECANSEDARLAYFVCLLTLDVPAAMEQIRVSMQDLMTLYLEGGRAWQLVSALREHEDARVAAFFNQAAGLCAFLDDTFYRSVILPGRNLRELMAQPERVRELGLSEAEEARVKLLRRTNDYPREMFAAAIAERVYRFMGIRGGVAEAFAAFAPLTPEVAELLRRIYLDAGEEHELIDLMQAVPALRAGHRDEYCRLLLANGNDDALQVAFAETAPETILQRTIAQILSVRRDGAVNADFELTTAEIMQCDEYLVEALFSELGRRLMVSEIYHLASHNIEKMIAEWPVARVMNMLTGGGELDKQALLSMQESALEDDCDVLAIALWTHLRVGDLADMADRVYSKMISEASSNPSSDAQSRALEFIGRLFPHHSDALSMQRIILDVQKRLAAKEDTAAIAADVALKMGEMDVNSEQFGLLLESLPVALLREDAMINCIAALPEQGALQKLCLAHYHRAACATAPHMAGEAFVAFVTRLYMAALESGLLTPDMAEEAAACCSGYAAKLRTEGALLCAVKLQEHIGRIERAEFVLHEALELAEDGFVIDPQFYEIATRYWNDDDHTLMQLFQKVLIGCTYQELVAYCGFCGQFVQAGEDARLSGVKQALLTEAECDQLLYGLYAHPKDISRWFACAERLPLQGDPEAQARLKLYSCQQPLVSGTENELRNRGRVWQACAEFCASRNLDERLLDTLIAWAEYTEKYWRTRGMYDLPKLFCDFVLEYEKALGIPDVWAKLYPEKTTRLQQMLMDLIPDTEGPLQRYALTACSCITVKLYDPAVLENLLLEKGNVMLSMRCDQTTALAARLLLEGRIAEAGSLIRMLVDAPQEPTYHLLLSVLAQMTDEELAAWCATPGVHDLLGFMLPNGDMPPVEVVLDWCMAQMSSGRYQVGRMVMQLLCFAFASNRPFYRMLFNMCKNAGMDADILREMHGALRGIMHSISHGDVDRYEIRSTKDFALILAGLNCVLIDRGWDTIEEYDFAVPAGDYLRSCSIAACTQEEIDEINEWQRSLHDMLQNQQPEMREQICRMVISWITGDWYHVIHSANEDQERWALLQQLVFPVPSYGFARSWLRFLFDLPRESWNDALLWMNTWETDDRKQQIRSVDQAVYHMGRVGDHDALHDVMSWILQYPLEETSMSSQIFNAVIGGPFLNHMASARQYVSAMLCLMANVISLSACNFQAYSAFREHHDRKATAMFYALQHVCSAFGIAPKMDVRNFGVPTTENELHGNVHRMKYLRYCMIKLSDDPQLFSDSMEKNLQEGNYCNLVLTLLCSDRANEALLLQRRLPRDKRPLVDLLLMLINKNITDAAKVAAVEEQPDETIRMTLLFLLGLNLNRGMPPASNYINSPLIARNCKRHYDELVTLGKRGERVFWRGMRPNTACAANQIKPPATEDEELDVLLQEVPRPQEFFQEARQDLAEEQDDILQAVNDLFGEPEQTAAETDAAALRQRYFEDGLDPKSCIERSELAFRLFRMAMTGTEGLNRYEWLVRFAMDAYMGTQEVTAQIRKLLLLTAQVVHRCDGELKNLFVNKATAMLIAFFSKRKQSLREFLDEYRGYRAGYNEMCGLLPDEESAKTFIGICAVLDGLVNNYSGPVIGVADQVRGVLRKAEQDLQEIKCPRHLGNVTVHLHSMLLTEFNNLDAQPYLETTVLNEGTSRHKGALYGQVVNTGRSDAKNIRIRATFGDGSHSEPYCLSVLAAKGRAVFSVFFKAPEEAETLSWQLDIECVDRDGNDCIYPPESGEIQLDEHKRPFFLVEDMNTQTIMDFTLNEDGTDVESPDFVGRENEKRSLRNLYDGRPFSRCRNAALYGIRRSGKTSLLYYIEKYLNATRKDMVAVLVAEQSLSTIWEIFAWRVLYRLKQIGELDESTALELENKWRPQPVTEDMDPRLLLDFYIDVKKALGGRGMVIIIDEFDRLLEKLDEAQKLENKLNPVLSSMFCNDVCAQTVHFLFCGGMGLKQEMYKDNQVTQVFQRLGETDIVIGAMPKQEMIDMVKIPYSIYPDVVFTTAAIEWLWYITGGLIWFTKLIVKDALSEAKKAGRSVLYPSDINRAANVIAKDNKCCDQLYEGFREDEKIVVEAMSNLTIRPDQYVKASQIADLVQEHLSRDRVDRALNNLGSLRIVETSRQNMNQYCFSVEFYRRYFRVQTGEPRLFPKTVGQDVSFRIQLD